MNEKIFNSVDLFSGAGGLSLGLEFIGFNPILFIDINKYACQTLKYNRPYWNVVCKDIRTFDFSYLYNKVDLLTGGFPCQSFSYVGKKLGFNDERGLLFFEMIRAIKEISPKVFLAENVKGLINNDEGKTLKIILNSINQLGYKIVEQSVYNTVYYNVPQKRERLIIIGVRHDLCNKYNYIKPIPNKKYLTVKDALKKGVLYKYDVPPSIGFNYLVNKKNIMAFIPEGGNWRDLPENIQKDYIKNINFLKGGSTGIAKRLSWDRPSLTLTCSPSQKLTERCHPSENRPLTIREYTRIQTFPDDWIFKGSMSQIYKQIGNAVPVNFSKVIGKSIMKMMNI